MWWGLEATKFRAKHYLLEWPSFTLAGPEFKKLSLHRWAPSPWAVLTHRAWIRSQISCVSSEFFSIHPASLLWVCLFYHKCVLSSGARYLSFFCMLTFLTPWRTLSDNQNQTPAQRARKKESGREGTIKLLLLPFHPATRQAHYNDGVFAIQCLLHIASRKRSPGSSTRNETFFRSTFWFCPFCKILSIHYFKNKQNVN